MPLERLLIIDDELDYYTAFCGRYEGKRYDIRKESNIKNGLNLIQSESWKAVLLDMDMGQGYDQGLKENLPLAVVATSGNFPLIVITSDSRSDIRNIIFKAGAYLIEKAGTLLPGFLAQQVEDITRIHRKKGKSYLDLETILPELKATLNLRASLPGIPVLLVGGTGLKTRSIVDYLHYCKGAVTALEVIDTNNEDFYSDLVGSSDTRGRLDKAGEDLLLIERVEQLSNQQQTQLDNILRTGYFRPLGEAYDRPLKAHLVFTTDYPDRLKTLVDGLQQRLLYSAIYIPPIVKRRNEIVPLLEYYFKEHAEFVEEKNQLSKSDFCQPDLITCLEDYHWPGNMEEIEIIAKYLLFTFLQNGRKPIVLAAFNQELLSTGVQPNPNTNVINIENIDDEKWTNEKKKAYEYLENIQSVIITERGSLQRMSKTLSSDSGRLWGNIRRYYRDYPDLFIGEDLKPILDLFSFFFKLENIERTITDGNTDNNTFNKLIDLIEETKSEVVKPAMIKTLQSAYNENNKVEIDYTHPDRRRITLNLLSIIDKIRRNMLKSEISLSTSNLAGICTSLISCVQKETWEQAVKILSDNRLFFPAYQETIFLIEADYDIYIKKGMGKLDSISKRIEKLAITLQTSLSTQS